LGVGVTDVAALVLPDFIVPNGVELLVPSGGIPGLLLVESFFFGPLALPLLAAD
jgi:hypothetical protein